MSEQIPLLAMAGVFKRFAGVQALQEVRLEVAPGEGESRIGGRSVVIRGVTDSQRAGVSFIHQELNVLDSLDVAGNVYLGREPLTGGPLRLVDRARMWAEAQPLLDRKPERYSFGLVGPRGARGFSDMRR